MFKSSDDEIIEVGGPLDHLGKWRHIADNEAAQGHTTRWLSSQVFCPNAAIGFFSLSHPAFLCWRVNWGCWAVPRLYSLSLVLWHNPAWAQEKRSPFLCTKTWWDCAHSEQDTFLFVYECPLHGSLACRVSKATSKQPYILETFTLPPGLCSLHLSLNPILGVLATWAPLQGAMLMFSVG